MTFISYFTVSNDKTLMNLNGQVKITYTLSNMTRLRKRKRDFQHKYNCVTLLFIIKTLELTSSSQNDYVLLDSSAVTTRRYMPKFRRNILSPPLSLESDGIFSSSALRMETVCSSKRWHLQTSLHGDIIQKNDINILAMVKTSHFTTYKTRTTT
jgi:hypothetical protein